MEDKTFFVIWFMGAAIVFLLILIAFQAEGQTNLKAKIEADDKSLKINQSWAEGWDIGYAWGAYNIFEEVMLKGFFAHNETWVLYSPGGCGAAFTAELESKGCEVVCAGPR